jgi:hypothetical protein
MVVRIAGDSVKWRISCSDGKAADVETDRLQLVIYVAGASLNGVGTGIKRLEQMLWEPRRNDGDKIYAETPYSKYRCYNRRP